MPPNRGKVPEAGRPKATERDDPADATRLGAIRICKLL
jgi:hypothetical protein